MDAAPEGCVRLQRFRRFRLAKARRAATHEGGQRGRRVFVPRDERRKGTRVERQKYREGVVTENLRRLVEELGGSEEFEVRQRGDSFCVAEIEGVGDVPVALLRAWLKRGWLGKDGHVYWVREEARAVLDGWDREQNTTREK